MTAKPVALSIAGSDPSGGAGIQADLKTFHQFGVYGQAAITLITAQNTLGVTRLECLAADLVEAQLRAVLEDFPPHALKTGALGNRAIVEAVGRVVREFGLHPVVDPVIFGKHGARLLDPGAVDALVSHLLPHAALLTPNLDEAALLTGLAVDGPDSMRRAAQRLCALGARSVLVKGGHLEGAATDILLHGGEWFEFSCPRIHTAHTHGTGCAYSAAIAAGLAAGVADSAGLPAGLPDVVRRAKAYIHAAIATAPGLGRGRGPVNHHAR